MVHSTHSESSSLANQPTFGVAKRHHCAARLLQLQFPSRSSASKTLKTPKSSSKTCLDADFVAEDAAVAAVEAVAAAVAAEAAASLVIVVALAAVASLAVVAEAVAVAVAVEALEAAAAVAEPAA